MRPIARPGAFLATGLLVVVTVSILPAGLHGTPVPPVSWISWAFVLVAAFAVLRSACDSLADAARRWLWLVPAVLLLTLPMAFFAAGRSAPLVAAALILRSLTAATAGLAIVTALGPAGCVAGLRALHLPKHLVAIVESMLVSLTAIARQVSGMLRARAARRTNSAPWAALVAEPEETLRGFGRLVTALFLRSVERAESLERARRARGGGDA